MSDISKELEDIVKNYAFPFELASRLKIISDKVEKMELALDALPDCPRHGKGCTAYPISWIERAKAVIEANGFDL